MPRKPRQRRDPSKGPETYFGGRPYVLTLADSRRGVEARRRKAAERRLQLEQKEQRFEQRVKELTEERDWITGYPNPDEREFAARNIAEIEQRCEELQSQRQGKALSTSTAEPPRRQLLPNETPLEGLKRINPTLYRDLLAQARGDESQVLGLLEAQGRCLWRLTSSPKTGPWLN